MCTRVATCGCTSAATASTMGATIDVTADSTPARTAWTAVSAIAADTASATEEPWGCDTALALTALAGGTASFGETRTVGGVGGVGGVCMSGVSPLRSCVVPSAVAAAETAGGAPATEVHGCNAASGNT